MIRDIRFDDEFYLDYSDAPEQVQRAMDKLVRMIADSGQFPNSMAVHKAHKLDLWIGYVTRVRQHWRVLFTLGDDYVTFYRLLDHPATNDYLRAIAP